MREITQTESTSTIKKKDARITWVRTEILFLFASFGLPYLMGLFFYLTTRYSLLDIFSHEKVIRYALLGVVFFFTFTFFSWYLHYRNRLGVILVGGGLGGVGDSNGGRMEGLLTTG